MTDDYARLSNFVGAVFDRHDVFRGVAEQIGDKRIFLTGGTGLFGQWVIALAEWMHRENLAAPRLTVLSRRDALPSAAVRDSASRHHRQFRVSERDLSIFSSISPHLRRGTPSMA